MMYGQAVDVVFRFDDGIVHKIIELDSSRQGFSNTVRAESSTGQSEEQSLILSGSICDEKFGEIFGDEHRIWIDRKQWDALVALVPDLLGWEAK
jgi:hypothetical protein